MSPIKKYDKSKPSLASLVISARRQTGGRIQQACICPPLDAGGAVADVGSNFLHDCLWSLCALKARGHAR